MPGFTHLMIQQKQRNDLHTYGWFTNVETTGFDGAGHAVETMNADRKTPALLSEDIPC